MTLARHKISNFEKIYKTMNLTRLHCKYILHVGRRSEGEVFFEDSSTKWYFDSLRRHSCLCAMNHPCASRSGGNRSHFVYVRLKLMSCDLRLTLGPTPLRSLIHVCASQHRWLNAIGQKKSSHWLATTRDELYRRMSSGQAHLLNILTIGAMDRTSAQP